MTPRYFNAIREESWPERPSRVSKPGTAQPERCKWNTEHEGSMGRMMPSNSLIPIVRTTLTADICRQMVNHLMRGVWSEGKKIPAERELCQQLGVGRAS